MPSEGSVHTLKFDTTDSSRPTAIALRLRERWLRLAQAPSSSPKFESDALLPCECRGALRRPERQSPGLLLRHVNRCQMTSPRLDVGEPGRNGQFGHVPPLRQSTTALVGAHGAGDFLRSRSCLPAAAGLQLRHYRLPLMLCFAVRELIVVCIFSIITCIYLPFEI